MAASYGVCKAERTDEVRRPCRHLAGLELFRLKLPLGEWGEINMSNFSGGNRSVLEGRLKSEPRLYLTYKARSWLLSQEPGIARQQYRPRTQGEPGRIT